MFYCEIPMPQEIAEDHYYKDKGWIYVDDPRNGQAYSLFDRRIWHFVLHDKGHVYRHDKVNARPGTLATEP